MFIVHHNNYYSSRNQGSKKTWNVIQFLTIPSANATNMKKKKEKTTHTSEPQLAMQNKLNAHPLCSKLKNSW